MSMTQSLYRIADVLGMDITISTKQHTIKGTSRVGVTNVGFQFRLAAKAYVETDVEDELFVLCQVANSELWVVLEPAPGLSKSDYLTLIRYNHLRDVFGFAGEEPQYVKTKNKNRALQVHLGELALKNFMHQPHRKWEEI